MDMLDHLNVDNIIPNQELKNIIGGATKITATLISSLVKGASLVLEIGRSIGTAIRKLQSGNLCK